MKIENTIHLSGKLEWLEVRDKNGKLRHRVEDVPNLLLNGAMPTGLPTGYINATCYLLETFQDPWEDLPGTWNQSGNTVTRATGAGTFPNSPSQLGNEILWQDGERCHVTARASDTSITVSGPARTITGKTMRRYITNGQGITSSGGSKQSLAKNTSTVVSRSDMTTGIQTKAVTFQFASATVAYSLGAVIYGTYFYAKLPSQVAVEIDDQVSCSYSQTITDSNREQTYELGEESTGIPQKHSMLSIAGDGANVDVTFSAATHFLAGDKLDLRTIVPKKFAIASASSTGTTFTINTAAAHGLTTGDPVIVEGASLAGYNGTFTVATGSGTVLTITDAANPGAMGASGTVRLTTPGTYFDDLGLATIASMVSSSVARITSAITGPAVDPVLVGGDPGVFAVFFMGINWPTHVSSGIFIVFTEANAKAVMTASTKIAPSSSENSWKFDSDTSQGASYWNDFTLSIVLTKNAGAGTGATRIKQMAGTQSSYGVQITFNTPFTKTTDQRLKVGFAITAQRDLDLTGLP